MSTNWLVNIKYMKTLKQNSLLWIVCTVITLSLLLYNLTGNGLSAEFFIISCLSIFCWLKFSSHQILDLQVVMPLYILSITIFLILCTIRYSSDYSMFLQNNIHGMFKKDFVINQVNWFLLMVCFPISTMLIGGYFLGNSKQTGAFFAWWTFFFCVAECLLQFSMELLNLKTYKHHYFLGVIVAMCLFVAGTTAVLKIANPSAAFPPVTRFTPQASRKINLWSILFVTLVIIYGITLYTQAGILPVGVIAGSMMGGMIGWRKTTARFPANPYKLVPLYLLLQALFYIHVGEETLTHFNLGIASISGHPWSDRENMYLIAFIGPVTWIFAAWSLWKGQAFGNFILWFMIVGMILGEPAHVLVFPIVRMVKEGVGYEYFSGMYTALFPMIPAILALTVIIRDHKHLKITHA